MYYKKTTKSYGGKKLSKKQKKEVKQLIAVKAETKVFHDSSAPFAVSNSGTIIQLSDILQNVGGAGRIGDEVDLSKISLNFDCISSQNTLGTWLLGDAYNNLRCIIFRWYENDLTSPPGLSEVLASTASLSYTYLAPYNYENVQQGKLHIVYDQVFILENTPYWNGSTTLFASGQSSIHNVMNKEISGRKLGKKKLYFNGSTISGTNHLYMLVISDSNGPPHPYAQYNVLISYTDS